MKWTASNSGIFKIRDVVNWLNDDQESKEKALWTKFWLKGLIPKIVFFYVASYSQQA